MQKKPSILIVDDTELNIDILIGILKHYDVIPALSGREALQIVQEEHVDLILLDIIMPEMDGFEVCRQLKADERTKNIPVIIITVINMEQDIMRAYDLGVSDYVSKPFNPVELLGKVKNQLELNASHLSKKIKQLCLSTSQVMVQDFLLNVNNQWKQKQTKYVQLYQDASFLKDHSNFFDDVSESLSNFISLFENNNQTHKFHILDAITMAKNIINDTLTSSNIQLKIDEKHPATATGIKNEYAQIVINLLSSVREVLLHRQVDAPTITIDITKKQNRSHVLIKDNSGKTASQDLEKMFDPIQHIAGHNNIKLFLAQSIIEKHGGSINYRPWPLGMEYILSL